MLLYSKNKNYPFRKQIVAKTLAIVLNIDSPAIIDTKVGEQSESKQSFCRFLNIEKNY